MDTTRIVTESARAIEERYVFAEVAATIAQRLHTKLTDGRYNAIPTPQALAETVTHDLQSINNDKHLRLLHHDDEVPNVPSEELFEAIAERDAAAGMDGIRRVERLDGNVALLQLEPLLYPAPIVGSSISAALQLIAKADALIIDLRALRGGDPHVVALICSYLFDGEPVHLLDMHSRTGEHLQQFWTLPYVPGPRFGGTKPIRVLTSGATFSGGEELANDLQTLGRATVIGERTGGGAHPRIGIRMHPHLELTVPVARPTNPGTDDNWEGIGIVPDVEVPAAEAFEAALRSLEAGPALK